MNPVQLFNLLRWYARHFAIILIGLSMNLVILKTAITAFFAQKNADRNPNWCVTTQVHVMHNKKYIFSFLCSEQPPDEHTAR